jgi:hypothetical protein
VLSTPVDVAKAGSAGTGYLEWRARTWRLASVLTVTNIREVSMYIGGGLLVLILLIILLVILF